jgi:hypothetical protein
MLCNCIEINIKVFRQRKTKTEKQNKNLNLPSSYASFENKAIQQNISRAIVKFQKTF